MCQLTAIQEQVRHIMERDSDSLVLPVWPDTGRALGVSKGTAYSMAAQGIIPTIRLGRRIVVPKAALLKMLEEATG